MKVTYSILSILMAGVLAVSCDLDRFPKDSIAEHQSLQNLSDAANWNNGIMAWFRARQHGVYTNTQEYQADCLNASVDFGNRRGTLHSWIALHSTDVDLRDIWFGYYSALTNVNLFLQRSSQLQLSEAEAATLSRYQGNAYFVRAYYYFNLAIRYGAPYQAATASTDLSVPLVTEFDLYAEPARATNEQVYKQIFSDIAEAKTRLANVKGKAGSNMFTIDAVTALEARVKLYMSDWNGAYEAATQLIASGTYPLVTPEAANFLNMWRHDNGAESILQMYVSKPDELASSAIPFGAVAAKGYCTPDWLPSQWLLDLYPDNDLRKAVYFDSTQTTFYSGATRKGISVVSKYMGNPKLAATDRNQFWGYVPDGRQAPKVFRIAEMYLIAAEAGFEAGKEDAVTYLNTLRESRGLDKVDAAGDALKQEIRDERLRELAFEGFRLWDLRRWGTGMQRRDPQAVDVVSKGVNTYYTLQIEPSDPKWVWGIPAHDLELNKNLKQNPGW